MEHRALGRSGVDVSRIILGCGNFGGIGSSPAFFGAGETEAEAHRPHGCRLGSAESRPSTPPTRTAAAAASRSSAAGFGRKALRCASGSSWRRRRSTRWPRARTAVSPRSGSGGRSRQACAPRRRRAYLCTSRTPWIRTSPSPRRSARSTSSSEKARSGRTAAATSTPPGSRKHSGTAVRRGRQNSYSLLEREDEERGDQNLRPGRSRLHAVQPAGRRLADREVPPRRGAAPRLADDAAPRPVPPFPGRSGLRRARGVRGAARASETRPRPPSPSPGCSAIRT